MKSNTEFKEEIEEVRDDLTKSGRERTGKNPNPGHALRHMLAKWSEEPHYSQADLEKYRNELWISLEEFERYLKQKEFGMEIELKNTKIQYRTRVDGLRAQASMRIEALESALIETKLKLQRERERADMTLAEMESRLLNQYMNAQDDSMERMTNMEATLNDPKF